MPRMYTLSATLAVWLDATGDFMAIVVVCGKVAVPIGLGSGVSSWWMGELDVLLRTIAGPLILAEHSSSAKL